MQARKSILAVMGILTLLFFLIGCSSNPMTSTQTIPINDNSGSPGNPAVQPDDNANPGSVEDGDEITGYDTTPYIDPDKEEENDGEEFLDPRPPG
jgi:hypothetical protein